MKTKSIPFCLSFLLISSITYSQDIIGFWGVDLVTVGERNLTPVAKWFRYHDDRTYQAGNGWSQNDIGTWTYDEDKNEFLPETSRGIKDEYGPFQVSFSDGKMFWKRTEDGMNVIVTLSRITEMPMSPKDSIAGNWDLISVFQNKMEITDTYDPDDKASLFVMWTGNYRKTNPDNSQSTGYWHMDAHHPELHMIDFDQEKDRQVFQVSFMDNLLIMKSKTDEGMTYTYKRK